MDEIVTTDFDYSGFGQRLKEAISPEKITAFADRVGVPQATVSKYVAGRGTAPRLDISAILADGAGCTLEWLVWGRGEGPNERLMRIPRYEASLAAGAGAWNEGRRRIEDIPFTPEFVRTQLGRTSTAGLTMLEARGDSMAPTIQDGARIVIDENQTQPIDDVFAFVLGGEARLKRFRRQIGGLQILSDNPAYPPERLANEQMGELQVIGRAIWVGQRI